MKVLVTGATGLLGRHLVPELSQRAEVIAVARREPGPGESEAAQFVHQDLTEPLEERRLPDRIDAVIHLAQSERYRDFPAGAEDLFEVNVHSTFRLLDWARRAGASRFVLASTGGLYAPRSEPVDESAPLDPIAPYFRSKRIAELLLDDFAGFMHGIVLRFFFVYGPGKGTTLIPRLAQRILAGDEIMIEGDPGLRINPIFVADAARAVEAAAWLDEPATVNVAGGEIVSTGELALRLGRALGREPSLRFSGEAQSEGLIADIGVLREKLGVQPATSLDDGLAAAARSFLDD